MTAGAVAVPTIIPLRAPVPGIPKAAVDTDTKIELHSGFPLSRSLELFILLVIGFL